MKNVSKLMVFALLAVTSETMCRMKAEKMEMVQEELGAPTQYQRDRYKTVPTGTKGVSTVVGYKQTGASQGYAMTDKKAQVSKSETIYLDPRLAGRYEYCQRMKDKTRAARCKASVDRMASRMASGKAKAQRMQRPE